MLQSEEKIRDDRFIKLYKEAEGVVPLAMYAIMGRLGQILKVRVLQAYLKLRGIEARRAMIDDFANRDYLAPSNEFLPLLPDMRQAAEKIKKLTCFLITKERLTRRSYYAFTSKWFKKVNSQVISIHE